MKTLKNILYCAIAALVSLSATSCVEEEVYTQGEPEVEGCYGVYFPASQEAAGDNFLDPEAPTTLTFKAARLNMEGAITVPVVVEASEEGVFTVSEIAFEDGQAETEFTVSFPDAELGKTYSCRLLIEDPLYAQVYGLNAFTLDFSISRIKWNKVLGENGEEKGVWRDDIVSSIFTAASYTNPYAEKEVEIYQREDVPGYYRIDNLYDETYVKSMVVDDVHGYFSDFTNASLFIDASNPEKVWIDNQSLGFSIAAIGGVVTVYSDVEETLTPLGYGAYTSNLYGTLKNGVIEFPAYGFLITSSMRYANVSGKTRLILPGCKAVDYSLGVSYGAASEGELPVAITAGADVAKVEYAIFEGRYDDGQIFSAATNIVNDKVADVREYDLTAGTPVVVSGLTTGFYTFVAVAYDAEGNKQKHAAVSFGYVAAGEERPVVLTAGLIVSDKYAQEGNTAKNSIEYYAYGEDIEEAYIGLYKTIEVKGATDAQLANKLYQDKAKTSLSAKQLSQLNNKGLSAIFEGLDEGTDYTLAIYASNGYEELVYTVSATTEGTPNPLQLSYSTASFLEEQPEESELIKTWSYYAKDYAAEEPVNVRIKVGSVTISDSTTPDDEETGMSFVSVEGLLGPAAAYYQLPDKLDFGYYNGILYSTATAQFEPLQGLDLSLEYGCKTPNGWTYMPVNFALIGGLVQDGVIAFCGYPTYASSGVEFQGLALNAYSGEEFAGSLVDFRDLLLVDPSLDKVEEGGDTPAPAASADMLNAVRSGLASSKFNGVQTSDIQIKAAIDDILGNPVKYASTHSSREIPMTTEVRSVAFDVTSGKTPSATVGFLKLERKF